MEFRPPTIFALSSNESCRIKHYVLHGYNVGSRTISGTLKTGLSKLFCLSTVDGVVIIRPGMVNTVICTRWIRIDEADVSVRVAIEILSYSESDC